MIAEHEWFTVLCFFVARIDSELPEDALYEERHYILEAESVEHATEMTADLVRSECISYANVYGEAVLWELAHPVVVKEIDSPLVSGAEVFSRFLDEATVRMLVEPDGEKRDP